MTLFYIIPFNPILPKSIIQMPFIKDRNLAFYTVTPKFIP